MTIIMRLRRYFAVALLAMLAGGLAVTLAEAVGSGVGRVPESAVPPSKPRFFGLF